MAATIFIIIIVSIIFISSSKNVLNYKLRKPFGQGVIISMDQEYIAIGDAVDGVRMFVEYDEDTIVFNEKWRKIHINELKVGDFIEVHTSGEVTLELPCTFYGEVILIL